MCSYHKCHIFETAQNLSCNDEDSIATAEPVIYLHKREPNFHDMFYSYTLFALNCIQ